VYIDDVVEATWRCVKTDASSVETFNVGTGQRTTVLQVAEEIVRRLAFQELSARVISVTTLPTLPKLVNAWVFLPTSSLVKG
jgi:nucleoside-diphosphate-sugar epimerase